MRELSLGNLNMEMVCIDLLMETFMKGNGKMTNNKEMGYLNLQMGQFIKENLVKVSQMVKENTNTIQNNLMISHNIMVHGKHLNLMVMVKLFITMEISIKVNFPKDKDVVLVHIILIKFTNILDNGNKIVFMGKVGYIKMIKYFFKAVLKKD
jgi:hypothetical protein